MQELSLPFPKTHDLVRLIDLLAADMPALERWRSAAKTLSELAIEVRYPGGSADEESARAAIAHYRAIRDEIRGRLGLSPENS